MYQTKTLCLSFAFLIALQAGCIQQQYYYGLGSRVPRNPVAQNNPLRFGGEHPNIDKIENAVQYPFRVAQKWFFNGPLDETHRAIEQRRSIEISQQYLQKNEMQDVYIDVREYAPGLQWERVKANPRISTFWKYTAGPLSVASYAILPRRAFHFDAYDPFANTLSINSYEPSAALYEAAVAKEYRSHPYLGTWSVLQRAPIFPVIQNTIATSDVLTYARVNDLWELEKDLYPTSYANLGAAAVMEGLSFVPVSAGMPLYAAPAAIAGGAATGAASGFAIAKQQEPIALTARAQRRLELQNQIYR